MGYLSGFLAENRDMEKEQFVLDVQTEVRAVCPSKPPGPGRELQLCRYAKRKQAYGMRSGVMPCFLYGPLHYNDKARGKIYYFALNGQTGKICGKLPVDREEDYNSLFSLCSFRCFITYDRRVFLRMTGRRMVRWIRFLAISAAVVRLGVWSRAGSILDSRHRNPGHMARLRPIIRTRIIEKDKNS